LTIKQKFVVIYAMTLGEIPGPDIGRDELNARAIDQAHYAAEKLRGQVIDDAYEAVKKFLLDDAKALKELEAQGFPKGKEVSLYLLDDILSAPTQDGDFTRTVSLLLERNKEFAPDTVTEVEDDGYPHSNDDQLRIHTPVPNDYRMGQLDIPPPNVVYVERIIGGQEESHSYYAIRRDGMYEYEPMGGSGEEVIYDDFSDRVLWRRITRRVDSGLPILSAIVEDLINMDAVQQRTFTVGEAGVQDR
jgi:hypothetical protein